MRQAAFIDDGSLDGYKKNRLGTMGIGIEYGSILKYHNLTKNYQEGAESILRVIEFYGSDYFIVINFFHRHYYFMKKGDEWRMSPIGHSIKPDLKHFVRVYFICAPGNARSALILFGDQSTLRKVRKLREGETVPRPTKKVKREMKEVKIGNEIIKKCRKTKEQIRSKRGGDIGTAIPNTKDERRLYERSRSRLFTKTALSMVHFGFGLTVALNALIFFIFFRIYKKGKPITSKKDGDGNGSRKETATTDTKTKSDKQPESKKVN